MKIGSGFAILDVKQGRKGLANLFRVRKPRPNGCGDMPVQKPIPVTITGFITDIWGNDDGVSREFEIQVAKVEIEQ